MGWNVVSPRLMSLFNSTITPGLAQVPLQCPPARSLALLYSDEMLLLRFLTHSLLFAQIVTSYQHDKGHLLLLNHGPTEGSVRALGLMQGTATFQ